MRPTLRTTMRSRWLNHGAPVAYEPIWRAMREFTEQRGPDSADEIWLLQHQPVYTLGQAGRREHLLDTRDIAVVACDRGGQVTYHGPGQVVAYVLMDLRRAGYFVKEYVQRLEDAVIAVLAQLGVRHAQRQAGAPGVYVPCLPVAGAASGAVAKIAALGVKVRNGCTYHGIAVNVAMDLQPFLGINPCGYAGLRTTDLATCGVACTVTQVGDALARQLLQDLSARADMVNG